jgi:tetratricopeptide (TPR) repeat protein
VFIPKAALLSDDWNAASTNGSESCSQGFEGQFGSWANMQKGSHLRIAGHSYVAALVEFTTQITDKEENAAVEHRTTGNSLFNSTVDTQNAATYNDRGIAKEKKGDLDGAMADYNQAIKLNPKDAAAYNNRGKAYSDKGDLELAIRDFNEAIRLLGLARSSILPYALAWHVQADRPLCCFHGVRLRNLVRSDFHTAFV